MNFEDYLDKKDIPHMDAEYMQYAIQAADRAKSLGDLAIGAVLVWPKRHLVEHDTVISDVNPLNTASMNVLRKALDLMPYRVSEGVLYTTLEPDTLSVMAACKSGVNEVIFGVYDLRDGFVSSKQKSLDLEMYDIKYKGGVLAKECFDLLSDDMKEYCSVDVQ